MDAASTAFSKIMHKGSKKTDEPESSAPGSAGASGGGSGSGVARETASIQRETAPAVQHETVQKKHTQREQKVVDRERHQDHYKTTVQPLQEREVMPERHLYEQGDVQQRHVDHRERDAKVMLERKQAQFKDTRAEVGSRGETVQEPTVTTERTMHHLHETIQPVIDKETVMPSVTHKKIPVHETVQDPSLDEGVTINPAMSREEFESRMRK